MNKEKALEQIIPNRVSNNEKLIVIDLEDQYPTNEQFEQLDISGWLFQNQILREKEFREFVDQHTWSTYKDKILIVCCHSDAILPAWSYLLLASKAKNYAKETVLSKENYITKHYLEYISNIDINLYKDKIVMIKGCSKHHIPQEIYLKLIEKIQNTALKISYGEACSSVPIYKKM